MSHDSVPKLISSVYTNTLVLVFCSFLTSDCCPGNTFSSSLPPTQTRTLTVFRSKQGNTVFPHCFPFSHFLLRLPQRMSLITLMPVRFPTHTDSVRSHSICTSACAPTGGVTGVQKASPPGMELQNTSWLSCRAAVCTDSTTSSFWQRNTLYL